VAKYVIIGGSAGGVGAVEAIREVDPAGAITVISEEPFPQYSRPMIADFLSGETPLEKMLYRDRKFWERNGVHVLLGRKAVSLDLTKRQIKLDDGDEVAFEKLLIATGGRPFIPGIEGTEKRGVFTFTTLSDAEALAGVMSRAEKAIVIGGGLIGVGATEALVKRGVEVTMVELKDKVLSLILDAAASDIVEKVIKKAGVTVVTGQTVKRIVGRRDDDASVGGVVLTNGEEVPCDVVIVAIGVIPRTELAAGTEIKVNKGILVDRFMRTNVPDVYACGDVAEAYDFIWGENRPLPLWPVAHLGGRVAGYNMAGVKKEYPGGTAMSALKYFDLPIISVGLANPDGGTYETMIKYAPEKDVYKKIVLKDDLIVGMILINEIEKAGIIFYLMKNRVNVEGFGHELLSDYFGLITLPENLRRMLLGD